MDEGGAEAVPMGGQDVTVREIGQQTERIGASLTHGQEVPLTAIARDALQAAIAFNSACDRLPRRVE